MDPCVIILGPAACGKTTLLNRTACGFAKDYLRGCPGAMVPQVVLVMHLAAWLTKQLSDGAALPTGNALLLEYMCQKDHGSLKTSPQYLELAQRFEKGELVLIFDGMDEAGEQLERISVYVGQFLCKNYGGRMIFSSRESLFDEQHFRSRRWTILQIQPLTEHMQDDVVRRRFQDQTAQAES
eukprot:COSAG01_NODE_31770_length_591_cov_9.404472_1_plen_181_part_01